jgi:rubrerythrin
VASVLEPKTETVTVLRLSGSKVCRAAEIEKQKDCVESLLEQAETARRHAQEQVEDLMQQQSAGSAATEEQFAAMEARIQALEQALHDSNCISEDRLQQLQDQLQQVNVLRCVPCGTLITPRAKRKKHRQQCIAIVITAMVQVHSHKSGATAGTVQSSTTRRRRRRRGGSSFSSGGV